jgi:hypothetical protein
MYLLIDNIIIMALEAKPPEIDLKFNSTALAHNMMHS